MYGNTIKSRKRTIIKCKINQVIREKTVKPARKSSNHLPTTLLYQIITSNTRFIAHSSVWFMRRTDKRQRHLSITWTSHLSHWLAYLKTKVIQSTSAKIFCSNSLQRYVFDETEECAMKRVFGLIIWYNVVVTADLQQITKVLFESFNS